MMLNRQRVVMLMLHLAGGRSSPIALAKLCFLLRHETRSKGGGSFYEFVPHQHGPFSFLLDRETDFLLRHGFLAEAGEREWLLTGPGRAQVSRLPDDLINDAASLAERFKEWPQNAVVSYINRRYPWFTEESCSGKDRKRQGEDAAPAVYTVGYEGLQVDGLLNRLLEHRMRRVVDVRRNPVARRYGFHGSTLARLCGKVGLEYVHVPELGIPSQDRRNLKTQEDYDALFAKYVRKDLPQREAAQIRVAQLLTEKAGVLLCQEADPARCHRSRLADVVARRIRLPVCHLGWPR